MRETLVCVSSREGIIGKMIFKLTVTFWSKIPIFSHCVWKGFPVYWPIDDYHYSDSLSSNSSILSIECAIFPITNFIAYLID